MIFGGRAFMRTVAAVMFGALLCTGRGVAQSKAPEVNVRAERTEQAAPGIVRFTGNVVLVAGKLTIKADSLEARTDRNRQETLILASGNVALEKGSARIQLHRLELDMNSGRGTFVLQP